MELKATLKTLGVAVALATASAAHALDTDWGSVAPGTTMTKTFSGQYLGSFEDTYSFSLLTGGDGALKRSITVTLDEDSVLKSGFTGLTYSLYNSVTNALIASTYEAMSKTYLYSALSAGSYYLKVSGTGWKDEGTAAAPIYNGFASITASVPEPQTYAMFLAGLGIVGTVIRRRSRSF